MPPFLKNATITVLYPIHEYPDHWTKDKIATWITRPRGKHLTKVTDTTTHVVCSRRVWRNQTPPVLEALQNPKIKVMTPQWLRDVLDEQKSRPKGGPYLWMQVEPTDASQAASKAAGKAMPRSVSGLMAEAFQEATEGHIDPKEKAKIEADLAKARAEAEAAKRKADEEERVKRKREKETAAIFAKGTRKAKNDIFSDNHHIYSDEDGFKFDVMLTKVDTSKNCNERLGITIYESNSLPPTYATNMHFAGTGLKPSNNLVAAIGSSFYTAFHGFKKLFAEKTGIEWDDRLNSKSAAAAAAGSQKGRAVNEAEVLRAREQLLDWEERKFTFHVPKYGPKGAVPRVVQEEEQGVERVRSWMKGASGGEAAAEPITIGHEKKEEDEDDATVDGNEIDAENHDFVSAPVPADATATTATTRAVHADSDFALFMSGALQQMAGDTGVTVEDEDFGLDTSYPFDANGATQFDQTEPVQVDAEEMTQFDHTQNAAMAKEQLEAMMGAKEMVGEKRKSVSPADEETSKKMRVDEVADAWEDAVEMAEDGEVAEYEFEAGEVREEGATPRMHRASADGGKGNDSDEEINVDDEAVQTREVQ